MKRIFKRRFISLILAAAMTVGTGYMPNTEGVEIGFTSPVMAETATEYTSTDTSTSTTESSTETTTDASTETTTQTSIEATTWVVEESTRATTGEYNAYFDATALTATADKEDLTNEEIADTGFTVTGDVEKRTNLSGEVRSVQIERQGLGALSVNAKAGQQLCLVYSSTGSTNTSILSVIDSAGNEVYRGEVTGSSNSIKYDTVYITADDTYRIISALDFTARGVMLYSASVGPAGDIEVTTSGETDTRVESSTETTTEATTEATTITLATPEGGATYTLDFSGVEAGAPIDGATDESGTMMFVSGNSANEAYKRSDSHTANVYDGDKILIAVAGNATITLALCAYGNGTEYVVTDALGNRVGTIAAKGTKYDDEQASLTYTGEATTLTLTLSATGESYLHGVTVTNDRLPIGEAEDFMFWFDDIAQNVESVDVATSESILTPTVEPGEYKFADSTVTLIGYGDTKFTNVNKGIWTNVAIPNVEGTHNFYKAGQRHATPNAIPSIPVAGDGTAVLFAPAAAGAVTVYYQAGYPVRVWDFDTATDTPVNNASGVNYVDDPTIGDYFYSFKAEPGHTYVISTTGKTNNCAYAGLEYIIDKGVSVPITLNNVDADEASLPILEVYLTDAYLEEDPMTLTTESTEIFLIKGHTYALTTNDGGVKATVNGSDRFTVDGSGVVVDLEEIPDVTVTGEITGTPEGTVTDITFTNMLNDRVYTGVITGTTYTAALKPGEYNTSVTTNNGGVTYDRVSVVAGADCVNEVYVELPSTTGTFEPDDIVAFVTSGSTAASRGNDFIARADVVLTIPVSGVNKIKVNSYYKADFTINGASGTVSGGSSSNSTAQIDTATYVTDGTETEVTITFANSTYSTNYLTSIEILPVLPYSSEISVPGDYDTLKEAVEAINCMDRPEGEAGRVTINMTADIQEQVVFDAPYVTLNGNGHELSWYYGLGTYYYSVDPATGLYNERLFRDKYSSTEGNGSLWGGVAIVRGDYFIAEDTTFRNTYNYWVTEKEVADFAGTTASTFPQRTSTDVDVTVYSAKERSNAFYIEAKNIEIYNCQILSSQDTFGRNGSANNGYSVYVKDSVIGGNTDYICGEFAAIFDNCELQWKTYANDPTNNGKVGYIVAPRANPYIFRNCTVTTDGVGADADVRGLYGRTWGSGSNCTFINTETNGFISETGWAQMSFGDIAATFREYGNTRNGVDFVTSGGAVAAIALTDEEVADYIGDAGLATAYGADSIWVPVHYSYEEITETTTEATTETTTMEINEANEYVADTEAADTVAGTIVYNGNLASIDTYQDMVYVADDNSAGTVGDRTYAGYFKTSGYNTWVQINGKVDDTGAVKLSVVRVAYIITAKQDVTIDVDCIVRNGKAAYFTYDDATVDGNSITTIGGFGNTGNDMLTTISVTIKAGETVYLLGQGTNLPIYGIYFSEPTTIEDTTETTTASPEADFELDGDTGAITGYIGAGGAVVIPDSIGGAAVTAIGDNAFKDCSNLTSISIPKGTSTIGTSAFEGCSSLTEISMPKAITTIDDSAFTGCTELKKVYCYIKTVANNETLYPETTEIKYMGDANCDGSVDKADAAIILSQAASGTGEVSDKVLDYERDNGINILDCISLMQDLG